MTKSSLIKDSINWGWLTGSEVQPVISKAGAWQYLGRHGGGGAESSTSSSQGCKQNTDFQASLSAHTHSNTPPTGLHLLLVPPPPQAPFPWPSIYKL
ncbi:mCG147104 [Mus musculus]|nr:mCG147104 [Mus musculus]